MRRAMILPILLVLAGCATNSGALFVTIAQTALEPYSFHVTGEAGGTIAVNSRFLAVDARVVAEVAYYGPEGDLLGAPIVKRWSKAIDKGKGKRAYEAVFGANGKFVEVRSVPWSRARASLPQLEAEVTDG